MKKVITSVLMGTIFAYTVIFAASYAKNNAVCDKFVRIHIIADSNEPYDQIVKMGIRNHIFHQHERDFAAFKSKNDAVKYINNNISALEKSANTYLNQIGYGKEAKVSISYTNFPQKNYGKYVLPQGDYTALKIILGSGNGRNFFCVMFPPMCVSENIKVEKTTESVLTKEELNRIKNNGNVVYKSKIAEIFNNYILR